MDKSPCKSCPRFYRQGESNFQCVDGCDKMARYREMMGGGVPTRMDYHLMTPCPVCVERRA